MTGRSAGSRIFENPPDKQALRTSLKQFLPFAGDLDALDLNRRRINRFDGRHREWLRHQADIKPGIPEKIMRMQDGSL
jgi:hypothetical protein